MLTDALVAHPIQPSAFSLEDIDPSISEMWAPFQPHDVGAPTRLSSNDNSVPRCIGNISGIVFEHSLNSTAHEKRYAAHAESCACIHYVRQ
jgi:hypothetical protein